MNLQIQKTKKHKRQLTAKRSKSKSRMLMKLLKTQLKLKQVEQSKMQARNFSLARSSVSLTQLSKGSSSSREFFLRSWKPLSSKVLVTWRMNSRKRFNLQISRIRSRIRRLTPDLNQKPIKMRFLTTFTREMMSSMNSIEI